MSMSNIHSTTLFDYLPTEIIFMIFDYLSNNHIIYTFFFFNKRSNNLLLNNQRYLELPISYTNTWDKILSIIGSQIESLIVNTFYLSFPLTYFPNLKSIIITSPHRFPDEELSLIVESEQFTNLHTLKIKQNKFSYIQLYDYDSTNESDLLKKVFTNKNSLKTFQYSFLISSIRHICESIIEKNSNLHSLTLRLIDFADIFILISYTPNLKYLNLQSPSPCTRRYVDNKSIKKMNIKLEKLYLTLTLNYNGQSDCDVLIDGIKQFRSSLTCLAINSSSFNINTSDGFPFNSLYLQQFLESMIELKQFHLYARMYKNSFDIVNDKILSQFKNQYWFDHNISFGMYGDYFYTLPFHFDHLYDFCNDVRFSNSEILITNPRIWFSVKSIDICADFNFIKELKMKMPRLNFIKFDEPFYYDVMRKKPYIDIKTEEKITLDNVTTIECSRILLENDKKWLINALPNLTHLILYHTTSSSTDSDLDGTLNEKIQRLDIVGYHEFGQFREKSYGYFSNVQYINYLIYNCISSDAKWHADKVMKILTNFKNLKTLLIYIDRGYGKSMNLFKKTRLSELKEYLNMRKIENNYQVKSYHRYLLFSKHEISVSTIQNGVLASIWRNLSFFFD